MAQVPTFEEMVQNEQQDFAWLFADNDPEDAGEPYAGTGRWCLVCGEEEGSGYDRLCDFAESKK